MVKILNVAKFLFIKVLNGKYKFKFISPCDFGEKFQ